MSADRDRRPGIQGEPAADDADLARVVRLAARAPLSAERRAAAYARVHAEWRTAVAARSGESPRRPPGPQGRPVWRAALAASAAAALLGGGLLWLSTSGPPPTMAVALTVVGSRAALQGNGLLDRWFGRERALVAQTAVRVGDSLATASDTAALLRVGTALTLRVAPDSQLRFDAPERVTLLRGRLYVDSGARTGRGAPLVVSTAWADVQHIGTRYLVQLTPVRLEVAVREGRVQLARDDGSAPAQAGAGEGLRVMPSTSAIERFETRTHGPQWAWLEAIPAPLDIEGATLERFLEWYAAESGRRIVFGSALERERLGATRLSGSVAGLSPDEALDAVAAIADLSVRRDSEQVIVEPARR